MARPRILPEHDVDFRREFRHLGAEGMAETYGVTTQAVYKANDERKLGLMPPRASFREFVPWRVAEAHRNAYELRMLRLYGKSVRGEQMTDKARRSLARFVAEREATQTVVAYDRAVGFTYVPLEPGDTHHVRRV